MSKFSEYVKTVKENEKERFFPNCKNVSAKYFTFQHYINDDEVVIVTSNVVPVKDSLVMLVANNKAVYLKDWTVKKVHSYNEMFNAYAVKLNRKFFKVYTFKNYFEGFAFGEHEQTFDDMVETAKAQDEENLKIALGHMFDSAPYGVM